jgi:hypothetical protein
MTSVLFEAFMVFYLLEVLVLSAIAINFYKEIKQESATDDEVIKSNGPSAAEMIKMRAIAKEMERQSK